MCVCLCLWCVCLWVPVGRCGCWAGFKWFAFVHFWVPLDRPSPGPPFLRTAPPFPWTAPPPDRPAPSPGPWPFRPSPRLSPGLPPNLAFFSTNISLSFFLRRSSRGIVALGRGHGPPNLSVWASGVILYGP